MRLGNKIIEELSDEELRSNKRRLQGSLMYRVERMFIRSAITYYKLLHRDKHQNKVTLTTNLIVRLYIVHTLV